MTAPRRPVRIANCSGFYGDRLAAAREMVEGGPIDVLTGDYAPQGKMPFALAGTREAIIESAAAAPMAAPASAFFPSGRVCSMAPRSWSRDCRDPVKYSCSTSCAAVATTTGTTAPI